MRRVGVFDSGIGGFSILREILRLVPSAVADYIADDSFAPYGLRSDEQIISRSEYITDILLKRGAELVVVACNSATAAAISALRARHPDIPFVGVEPYINVLNHKGLFPGISKAAVVTTELTGRSQKFRALRERLDPEGRIAHVSLPNLATIVEQILTEGTRPDIMKRFRKELKPLRGLGLSHLILGCTHYPLVADLIERELNLITISPGPNVARRVSDLLGDAEGPKALRFNFMSTTGMEWKTRSVKELEELLGFSSTGG